MSARVLITGASGGIGAAAMAQLRSRAGVIACDLRDADAVEDRGHHTVYPTPRVLAARLSAR